MKQGPVGEVDSIARAVEAAEQVFDPKPGVSPYEPSDTREARAAVQRLGELFAALPSKIAEALDGARNSGTLVSSDRLQGLAEIVQNADDAGASEVRLLVTPTDLLVTQNGNPVRLPDVLGFATPWLSTKTNDATAIGRFGVGLSALQSLSKTLDVHCAPYHFRIGDPTVGTVEPPDLPPQFREPGWTTLRVPLSPGMLQPAELEAWLNRWDDSALLFLRHVDLVTLLDENGDPIRRLELSRQADDPVSDSERAALGRGLAGTADGRSWAVYNADIPAPSGLSRAHKATGPMTPIAVALPLEATEDGQVHAGLPVTPISSPLFVNAQFDPLTSRTDFADTVWNEALVNLVAGVWSQAVLDLFARDPQAAWQVVPLPSAREGKTPSRVVQALEAAIIEKARQAVAPRLSFSVPEQGQVNLSQLAVESEPLEGILEEGETARLAGLSETLPMGARDPAGRWRSVLDDWRSHGADLPVPVGVERALDVVGDEERPASSTIALVAVALREGLDKRLLKLRCIIAHDGRRLVPPAGASAAAVSVETVPLAEQLSITTRLHPAHSSPANGAPEVLAWLRECGAFLDGSHGAEVVRRLAKAGRSGRSLGGALTDEQARALRDAFEQIDRDEATQLGPDVGRAVWLESYTYDAEGEKQAGSARPADSYLPRAIDHGPGSFSVAAGALPGLTWLSDRYARSLRSEAGREGIGALRFLRLLGAETAPRLHLHPQRTKRYQADLRRGLPLQVQGGPVGRVQALRERGAEYTLQDHDSPDLLSVIRDISQEGQSLRRRRRAVALLAALGRAWDRRLSHFAEVDAAAANYRWQVKGRVPAFWLARAGDVAWLDDESGTPRKPTELSVRTPGTEAIYGASSPGYLHEDFKQPIRRELLGALGVSSDPTRSELVGRLRELRHASSWDETPREDHRQDSALVYRALARSLGSEPRESDLTPDQVRLEFQRGRLLLTNQGWLSPRSVLAGPPIFGDLRPFAPSIAECEPLWGALWLRQPSPGDCLDVLRQVARGRKHPPDATEEVILLETLGELSDHHARGNAVERQKLATLSLWTSQGWKRDRPVYASDDPVLAAGLGDRIAMWQPGGGLEQFRPLLKPLRVTEIEAVAAEVVEPELAWQDHGSTALFRHALELLREDLQRNDRRLAEGLTVPWDSLAECVVKVHPSLALSVGVAGQEYGCDVNAKVETTRATVFVSEPTVLARVDGGGRALSALFKRGARLVAQAWRAACDKAEEGIEARAVELASERARREKAELDSDPRLEAVRGKTALKHGSPRAAPGRAGKAQPARGAGDEHEQSKPSLAPTNLRTLVDPQSLVIVDADGRMHRATPGATNNIGGRTTRGSGLKEPRGSARGPRNRAPLRGYSDTDREDVGLELLRMLLSTDEDRVVDLRSERGVGADAVDQMKQYYELKVSAGPEPDTVTLTDSEVRRALTTPDFFLVVVSNIEGADARPTVRLVVDPLNELRPTERGTIHLSGVRDAASLVYQFAPDDDEPRSGEGK